VLDLLPTIFSCGVMVVVVFRAVQLDRLLPWFGNDKTPARRNPPA
jgi:hypothetical protein